MECGKKSYSPEPEILDLDNLERRIRQHNRELAGGAKYTTAFKGYGIWKYHLYISNLTKSESLSIERSVKNTKKGLVK